MTDLLWRICADCWDWIWPGEPTYADRLGRSPICAVCHVRSEIVAESSRPSTDTHPDNITEKETT